MMRLPLCVLLAVAVACAGDIEDDEADLVPRAAIDRVQLELATLAQAGAGIGAPPTRAAFDALVAGGFPKPATPDPVVQARAKHAHDTLMRWGHDLMHRALLAATASDPATVRTHAVALRAALVTWIGHGTWFGDRQDTARYGNVTLEMTWFLGNAARAAALLEALSSEPGSGATGVWSASDHAAFEAWADALASRYVAFSVFPAGLSNRKASQIETLARVAELDRDAGRRAATLAGLFTSFQQLLVAAIRDDGFIPEDSCRDKYHDQFFLASALQTRALFATHGLRLELPKHNVAVNRLLAAVTRSANRNLDASKPPECPTIGDSKPNHDIPFWALAPQLYQDYGRAVPAAVATMVTRQYVGRVGYDLVMQWGYNAVSSARRLAGNVHATRRQSIVEAEAFVAGGIRYLIQDPRVGGGRAIGGILTGDSWDYDYPVVTGGTRPVSLLVASLHGGRIELSIVSASGQEYRKATLDVPATGSFDTYRWITASVTEPIPGPRRLRVRAVAAGFNLDALRFAP